MLGSPDEPGFWDSWRAGLGGYSFRKMKTFVTRCSKGDVEPMLVKDFDGYVLTFFSTGNPGEEAELVGKVGRYIDAHAENQPAIQFLIDVRATAWRLMLDNSGVRPETVAAEWEKAEVRPPG
jgi:hypothetical protein